MNMCPWENKFSLSRIFSQKKLGKFSFKFTQFSTFSFSFSYIWWVCSSRHLKFNTKLSILTRMKLSNTAEQKKFTFSLDERLAMNDLTWWTSSRENWLSHNTIFHLPLALVCYWKFPSQFFINTCFQCDMRSSIALSWCIFVIILKCPWEIIAVWRFFFSSCPWMRLKGEEYT